MEQAPNRVVRAWVAGVGPRRRELYPRLPQEGLMPCWATWVQQPLSQYKLRWQGFLLTGYQLDRWLTGASSDSKEC